MTWVETNIGVTKGGHFRCVPCTKTYDDWNGFAEHAKKKHQMKQSTAALGANASSNDIANTMSAREQEVVNWLVSW